MRADARPEGRQHGWAAREVLPVKSGHRQAKGALRGDAVAQRVAAVAAICDADRVRAQAPDGRLERIAARSPLIAKLIACLQCIWNIGTPISDGFSPSDAPGYSSAAAAFYAAIAKHVHGGVHAMAQ